MDDRSSLLELAPPAAPPSVLPEVVRPLGSAGLAARAAPCPLPNRPILVTGAFRSGTTWVGAMIASHPGIASLDEPFNCYDMHGLPPCRFCHHVTAVDENLFRRYLEGLLRFQVAPRPRAAVRSGKGWRRLLHTTREELRLLRHRRRRFRPLMKDPVAFFSAEWLAATFGMDVIVLIRHPAGFASSLKRLKWGFDFNELLSQPLLMEDYLSDFHDDIARLARQPADVIDQSILLWRIFHAVIGRYQAAHPDWQFARHEDLSREPLEEFARLLWRISLDMTPRVRRTIEEHSSEENPREAREGVVHQLRRDSGANVWSWKYRLSRQEISRIRRGTEDVAAAFYSDEDW
jgi:hypothetical protein